MLAQHVVVLTAQTGYFRGKTVVQA